MHIPDGYLGPVTYGAMYGIMMPIWAAASWKVKRTLNARQVPYLSIGAAFSFVIMMFNIPVIGGTTGHAVGATLVAILLGPWAATIAVSIALIIQALLFGDGGITTIGANCFAIAAAAAFTGSYLYRLIGAHAQPTSRRRVVGAAVAAYVSLNVSALVTALLLGIQPLIAKTPSGQPLYSPFPLEITIPAMAFEHLVLFGFVEALITALVIRYVQKNEPAMLSPGTRESGHGTAGGLS